MSSVLVVYDLWDRLFLLILVHHSLLIGGSFVYIDISFFDVLTTGFQSHHAFIARNVGSMCHWMIKDS